MADDPHSIDPQRCHAEFVGEVGVPVARTNVTPEWLAENAAKRKAYERERAQWRNQVGLVELK